MPTKIIDNLEKLMGASGRGKPTFRDGGDCNAFAEVLIGKGYPFGTRSG